MVHLSCSSPLLLHPLVFFVMMDGYKHQGEIVD